MIKETSSREMLDRWQQKTRQKQLPARVMIELTYRCNFKCSYCYVPGHFRRAREMSYRTVCSLLRQLKDIGCLVVGFTGGEPFLRPDILKIITYAKSCGMEVVVHTNGSCIDSRMARALGRLRLNKVDLTVNSLDRKTFETISGVKGSFSRVMRALKLLRRYHVPLGVKTCLLPANTKEVARISAFSRSLGAMHRVDSKLFRRLDGAETAESSSSYANVKRGSLLPIQSHMRKADLLRCGIGRTQAAVTPDAKLKWCLLIDYPRIPINGRTFLEAWQMQRALFDKQAAKGAFACGKCGLSSVCSPCPAYGWLLGRDFFACPPEARKRAQALAGCA